MIIFFYYFSNSALISAADIRTARIFPNSYAAAEKRWSLSGFEPTSVDSGSSEGHSTALPTEQWRRSNNIIIMIIIKGCDGSILPQMRHGKGVTLDGCLARLIMGAIIKHQS